MAICSSDRLQPLPYPKRTLRHWRNADLARVAIAVAEYAGITGDPLKYTRIDGRAVFPFVEIDEATFVERAARGNGPVLDRETLRDQAAAKVPAPPAAVRLSGYVTVEPFADVKKDLAGLRTWAPTCAAVPEWRPLDPFEVAQCDYFGHCVVAFDGQHATAAGTKVTVDPPSERPGNAWNRLRNEQLFQFALDTEAYGAIAVQSRRSDQRRMPAGSSQSRP